MAALSQAVALAMTFGHLLLVARQGLASVSNGLARSTDLGWHGLLAVLGVCLGPCIQSMVPK